MLILQEDQGMQITQRNPVDNARPEFCAGRKVSETHKAPSLALTQRRSHLPKPHGAACDRRRAGADFCHSASNQSAAEGMGTPSRQRTATPLRRSKKI